MLIPNTVRINGIDYSVDQTTDVLVLNGRECYGLLEYDFHKIRINTNISDKQEIEKTFLHELFHAIINERSLNLNDQDVNEEKIVEEFSKGLYQVIKDNPNLFSNSTDTTQSIDTNKDIKK